MGEEKREGEARSRGSPKGSTDRGLMPRNGTKRRKLKRQDDGRLGLKGPTSRQSPCNEIRSRGGCRISTKPGNARGSLV